MGGCLHFRMGERLKIILVGLREMRLSCFFKGVENVAFRIVFLCVLETLKSLVEVDCSW